LISKENYYDRAAFTRCKNHSRWLPSCPSHKHVRDHT